MMKNSLIFRERNFGTAFMFSKKNNNKRTRPLSNWSMTKEKKNMNQVLYHVVIMMKLVSSWIDIEESYSRGCTSFTTLVFFFCNLLPHKGEELYCASCSALLSGRTFTDMWAHKKPHGNATGSFFFYFMKKNNNKKEIIYEIYSVPKKTMVQPEIRQRRPKEVARQASVEIKINNEEKFRPSFGTVLLRPSITRWALERRLK